VTTPKSVIRAWLPAFFVVAVCLFLSGKSPAYWLLILPLLPILIFMIALAEVHDEGRQIQIRRLWTSFHIPKEDILGTSKSFLDGIGVLHPRRFAFPFGHIYFVYEWSDKGPQTKDSAKWDLLASTAMAISGFFAARVVHIHGLGLEAPQSRILAIGLAGALCVLFAATRKKKSGFANCVLFIAAYIIGLVHM
jgi:hypothetical protein